jgi:starch phosphorylase
MQIDREHQSIGDNNAEMEGQPSIAYFTMEVGLECAMPTYSGGLGILAGDTLRAAADLNVPLVGVTLLHRRGYLRQLLDREGTQTEAPSDWYPEEHLRALPQRITVEVEGRPVLVRAWQYSIAGANGGMVPVFFLDTNLRENTPEDRRWTDFLYGGDSRYRLGQEVILGIGGVAMLRALGFDQLTTFHMNEGHCSLLSLALLRENSQRSRSHLPTPAQKDEVRRQCVFTTHTPVPAGHDVFPMELVSQVLGRELTSSLLATGWIHGNSLNMTLLALNSSRSVNGVSKRHAQVSQTMHPEYRIDSITNGVHAATWAAPSISRLYDEYIPDWRRDNQLLEQANEIPLRRIRVAKQESKSALLAEVVRRTGAPLNAAAFTIAFARRAAAYKRADLLFNNPDRLRRLAQQFGTIQVLFAGKAHAQDQISKEIIRRVYTAANNLRQSIQVVYLENYDMDLGHLLCAGVDLWLNTPQRPLEASGTSGMKAALNGVPSLSILDGWWEEGHIEGVTGWSIDEANIEGTQADREAESLYRKLEQVVLPAYYGAPDEFTSIRRSAMAINGTMFNTHRMVAQYLEIWNDYSLESGRGSISAACAD